MKLYYFVKEGEYAHRDSYDGDYGLELDYEPNQKDVNAKLAELIKTAHFGNLVEAFPQWEEDIAKVVDSIITSDGDYFEKVFIKELTEAFREEAMRSFY